MAKLTTSVWPELGHTDVVLIPLGSTEQHGPHLPFDTDTVIAAAVAEGLAEVLQERGLPVVLAPAVTYGASGEHQDFPGTVSLGSAALEHLLIELARSVKTWAPRLVFVNGHGGNISALTAAVRQLTAEEHEVCWLPCAVPDADAHAGREETSLLLLLAPERVRLQAAEPGEQQPLSEIMPRLQAEGVRAVSANGILGDPTGAHAAEGQQILEEMVGVALERLSQHWPALMVKPEE